MQPTSTIPIEECIKRRVYKIRCRNLSYGVYDGNTGFIGIRTKFGSRYLFTEYHWDVGAAGFGTVRSQIDTGIDVPTEIKLDDLDSPELFKFLDNLQKKFEEQNV